MMQIRKAPKTDAVYELLKGRIASGAYAEGPLPVEPVLAGELQVSRKTLRSALSRLALEDFIVRVKGEGTFVNRDRDRRGGILVLMRDEEDITNPDRYILPGIQQEAASMGLQVETCTLLSLAAGSADAAVRRVREKTYSGILCMASNFRGDEPFVGILKRTDLPVLLPHAFPGDVEKSGFAAMGTDYRKVMRDGLQYLISLGHRRVAYLAYRERRIDRKSYFRLLEELGLDSAPELYVDVPSPNDHDRIAASVETFFSEVRGKPTAILCFSDYFAVCLCEYLRGQGIRIPEDVAVLSIGGMIGCDFLTPPLSAIDFGCVEIGRAAVRKLLEMRLDKTQKPFFLFTPHHLTERESTRKPSGKESSK